MTCGHLEFHESASALDIRIRAHIQYSSLQMESLLDGFLSENPQSQRTLDIGCGSGNYSDLFAKSGSLYVGLDANTGLLGQAREKCVRLGLNNALFLQWNMNNKFPFVTESFDFIFSGFSSYYVDDAFQLVNNCFEVLCPDGQIWFVGPASGNAAELDSLSEALFGVPSSQEKDIRAGRLQSEFHPAFLRVFGNCDVIERDFSLNFPDPLEYARYYLATPQYIELAEKFGAIRLDVAAEKIMNIIGLKLTKKSLFLAAKK